MSWGAIGCACYLCYGIKKVVPIVLDGLRLMETAWQWAFLVATLLFFAYYEGYKGFQKGFSPRVVSRAWVVAQQGGGPSAKDLLKRYGSAYLATSISLSLVSVTAFYALVRAGIDVASAMAALGLAKSSVGQQVGFLAIAYALHKAASPVRFPFTVALTPFVARCLGKEAKEEADAKTAASLPPLWHKVLAPWFCIGYFHGTRKRVTASWCVTTGVFLIVVGVKRLANPYRAIIDAGVMLGLSWGAVSVVAIFVRSLLENRPPDFDPALPEGTPYRVAPA